MHDPSPMRRSQAHRWPRAARLWVSASRQHRAAAPPVLVSRSPRGLGTDGGSRVATRPQAELPLRSIILRFPGPNMRQRKGSSICALPKTRRCAPRWQLPLCGTFSLFFSRCREPSLVSDAERVFAVCVQRDWSSYFRAGTGMEEQSFALIANLNTFFFFPHNSSISRATSEYEARAQHVGFPAYFDTSAAPCFELAGPGSASGTQPLLPRRQSNACPRLPTLPPAGMWRSLPAAPAQHRTSGWPGRAEARRNYPAHSHRVASRAPCRAGVALALARGMPVIPCQGPSRPAAGPCPCRTSPSCGRGTCWSTGALTPRAGWRRPGTSVTPLPAPGEGNTCQRARALRCLFLTKKISG